MGPRYVLVLVLAALPAFCAAEKAYELNGKLEPGARASVGLHGAVRPFSASVLTDSSGTFRFRKLAAGTYTVAVFVPGRGETRQTIDVGPGTADNKGRVRVTIQLDDSRFAAAALRSGAIVSRRELSVPESARHEYDEAQKSLARYDVTGAAGHLKKAVEIAPQFAAAWNNLGTIAYQTRQYEDAEDYFRKALEQDGNSFEALVNLGGVLVTLLKVEEALRYNTFAVLSRPNDALANSQLGMTYFELGKLDLAEKHLLIARKIDPGHFSHPQLLLAEIYLRRNRKAEAAAQLEEFVRLHPDSPDAAKLKAGAEKLRAQ